MYNKIKQLKGEKFAKTIRGYHNGIFEIPNILEIVRYSGDDAEPLLSYLVNLITEKTAEKSTESFDILLNKAGYEFVVADTAEKQNSIKKYFALNEKLCTFGTDRYKNYYIVNVWRKNINEIKRENFTMPKRDDEYGTSCMSIQMAKKGGFISIKNRYNHTVNNCDNTLNSNPDNIILGLSDALQKHFKIKFTTQSVAINGNYHLVNKCIYNYNYEINGIYVGENFYIKNGEVIEINQNEEIILDYFLLNLKTKKIACIVDINDCFAETIENEIKNKTIRISKKIDDIEKYDEFLIIKI